MNFFHLRHSIIMIVFHVFIFIQIQIEMEKNLSDSLLMAASDTAEGVDSDHLFHHPVVVRCSPAAAAVYTRVCLLLLLCLTFREVFVM